MTQRAQVLSMLREAGSRGVHTFELRRAFVGNPSQRISELEALGHRITHRREKLHGSAAGTRYVLQSAGATDTPTTSDGGLVGLGRAASAGSSNQMFDPWETAA